MHHVLLILPLPSTTHFLFTSSPIIGIGPIGVGVLSTVKLIFVVHPWHISSILHGWGYPKFGQAALELG